MSQFSRESAQRMRRLLQLLLFSGLSGKINGSGVEVDLTSGSQTHLKSDQKNLKILAMSVCDDLN